MSLKAFFIWRIHIIDSSSIIKDIHDMCPTGLAILAIFYFHFGDTTKQDARNLLSSILNQLCSQSDKFCQVLSSIYSSLDECPNSSGVRTQRQEVLEILKELIELKLPHLHFCVTSRPEIDIRRAFDPLDSYNVSLHNQDGQIKDLAEYVKAVVGSDATMQNWPADAQELVIDYLAKKGGGMYVIVVPTPSILFSCHDFRFRWAYCQLEILRQCPLRYISSTLDELPETLDETYERILQGIPKKMQKDAHRILLWLTVSSRPLRVEELAEVFAINFDEEISGIPKFEPSWRDANAETAVLTACSTLVAVVDAEWDEKIVQFSHFSVKEYLTSDRIANVENVSRFHVYPKPAHILLAKSCLSVLFQLDHSIDEAKMENFPLAGYTAEHWMEHAQFEDASSYIQDGMDLLFEKDKPHFSSWVRVYDVDEDSFYCEHTTHPEQPCPVPLYYAALCGFGGLVERLLTAHPQDLNAQGGVFGAPLNAALAKGHLNIALFLLSRGADGENGGKAGRTGLYIASSRGHANVVRPLIDRGVDLNAMCQDWFEDDLKWTPLHAAIYAEHRDIVLLLLEGGADTETRSSWDETAIYTALRRGCVDIVWQLIIHGADLNAECGDSDMYCNVKWTLLRVALFYPISAITRILLEHGVNPNTPDGSGGTALHLASCLGDVTHLELLLEYGATVDFRDKGGWTPLHKAAYHAELHVMAVLLDRGADPHSQTNKGKKPIQLANAPSSRVSKKSKEDEAQIMQLLSEYTFGRM
jgi:ankyrin repeat protein